MKLLITIFINISVCTCCFAQQLQWVQDSLYDSGFHFGNCVSTDGQNNIYTSSIYQMDSPSQTEWGTYISKRNPNGDLMWRKFLEHTEIWGIVADSIGNLYMSGNYMYYIDYGCGPLTDSSYYRTFSLAKMDTNGICIWSKTVDNAIAGKIAIDKLGESIYLIGSYYPPTQFGSYTLTGTHGRYLVKYSSNGDVQWVNQILNSAEIQNIFVNKDYVSIIGNCFGIAYFGADSTAFSLNDPGHNKIYTALYKVNGSFQWAKETVIADYDAFGNSITIDANNNVYVTGSFYNNAVIAGKPFSILSYKDVFLVKYDVNGDTLFATTLPGVNSENSRGIYVNENGVYFSGECYSQMTLLDTTIYPGAASIVLAKFNSSLTHTEWVKTYSSPGGAHSEILQITSDRNGNVIACGDYTTSLQIDSVLLSYNNWAYKKPFVMSLKEVNSILSTSEKPVVLTNLKVYPNPTGSILTFEYHSSSREKLHVFIYNSLGKLVYQKEYSAFSDDLKDTIDIGILPKGIYLMELISGNKKETKRICLN